MKRGARLLLVTAVVVIVAGLSKVHAAAIADPPYDYTGSFRFGASIGYVVLLVVCLYGAGLPDLPRSPRSALLASLGAAGIASLTVSAVQLATGDAMLPRFVVFGAALLVVPLGVACNAIARIGTVRAEQRDRVVVVGEPDEAAALVAELATNPVRPAVVVAEVDPAELSRPGRPLVELVEQVGATVVVLNRAAQADDLIVAQAASLHERGTRLRTVSLFYDEWLGKLPVSELERVALFFDIGELHRARYGRAKRVFDVCLGLVGLIPLALSIPFVVVGDLVANRGPLLYRQERVGRFGRRFRIVKFRTMRPVADDGLPDEWTTEDDPRITPFGRFMRLTHLDELPQVVNILKGDLSVVGPRPEQPRYVTDLTEKLPFYDLRHLVRPGLTGWAQVEYGYAGDEADALEKLQYEFFYLRHQSLGFDARIVGRTIRSVLGSQGRGR